MKTAYIGSVQGQPKRGTHHRHLLLGGVGIHNSAYFASRTDAESWVGTIAQTNRDAGRRVGLAEVSEVLVEDHEPVILPTCALCSYVYHGDKCDNPGCEASGNVTPEVLARREREDSEAAERERIARIRRRLCEFKRTALACAGFLLFAGIASAAAPAPAPLKPASKPVHAPVEICRRQPNGTWAKRTPTGRLSTIACELAVTIRLTDRARAVTVKRATPTTCLVWVPESTDTSHGLGPAAWDACIDAMHAAAEKDVAP